MQQNVQKTTPSEDIAWLAGIVDGEGTIGIYNINSQKRKEYKIFNLTVVNTDINILTKVEEILTKNNIFFSKYLHNNKNPQGFISATKCYVITVRRRNDFEEALKLLEPFLIGKKKKNAQEALEYLIQNPRLTKIVYVCKECKKQFTGRKRQFCSLTCWHIFSTGSKNPNYRHGQYITRND